ncbi:MAG: acetyl-CoA hydrolase/transferase C-terminal domain-containing protein [Nocardioidaceae bacterium]
MHATRPRSGAVSLGIEVNVLPAAIEQVRRRGGLVFAQINPAMPYTHGDAIVPVIASFLYGSPRLYEWVHDNGRVRVMRTETTNNPGLIRQHRSMVSINTALQVDLFGQSNASRIGRRIHSGIGGQVDFIEGALHAVHPQAIIALRSWHPRARSSAVVPWSPSR